MLAERRRQPLPKKIAIALGVLVLAADMAIAGGASAKPTATKSAPFPSAFPTETSKPIPVLKPNPTPEPTVTPTPSPTMIKEIQAKGGTFGLVGDLVGRPDPANNVISIKQQTKDNDNHTEVFAKRPEFEDQQDIFNAAA